MENFLKIYNIFFEDDVYNLFAQIGTEGFTLYTYLLYEQESKPMTITSIKKIQSFMCRDYDKRPKIKYDKHTECKISCLHKKETIINTLRVLEQKELIFIDTKIDYNKLNINTNIVLKCKEFNTGFEPISTNLFIDKIHKIGHIGWSLLCFLTKCHNISYGGIQCDGFGNPTEDYIERVIKRNIKTIRGYSELLEKQHLIRIEQQQPVLIGEDQHGKGVFDYIANHYIVKSKTENNKYNLESKKESK